MKSTVLFIITAILLSSCQAFSPVIPQDTPIPIIVPTYDPNSAQETVPTAPAVDNGLSEPWPFPHSDDFSDPGSGWETGEWDVGFASYGDGYYQVKATSNGYFMWGEAYREYGDVIIEVDATQVSGPDNGNTGYGIMCRCVPSDGGCSGYVLQISADGWYTIQKSDGGDYYELVEWAESSLINQGNATNHLRAECVGSALRLIVNGELLAETQDSTYPNGDIGLVAVSFEETPVMVHFDNLYLSEP